MKVKLPIREYPAKLHSVYDGDTVRLIVDQGFGTRRKERFRLAGINCPEIRSKNSKEKERGIAAREYVKDMFKRHDGHCLLKSLQNKRGDKSGKYGRYIAIIHFGSLNLNENLVANGHAVKKEY